MCVGFSFFSTMSRDWLERTSPKRPALFRVGRKTLTQSIDPLSRRMHRYSDISEYLHVLLYVVAALLTVSRFQCEQLMKTTIAYLVSVSNGQKMLTITVTNCHNISTTTAASV